MTKDPYLVKDASLFRLLEEYKKYGCLVVAYDFDNTVYDYHKKGHTYTKVIELLRGLKKIGCYLICFTASPERAFLIEYLKTNNIPFDAINENPPFFKSEERKIYYNSYLDDRAGLLQVYEELDLLVHLMSSKQIPSTTNTNEVI